MKPVLFAAALAAAVACVPAAIAQSRPFDPRSYQARVVGEPTQILVLGTPHLSGTPDDWDPATLAPLLDRLAAFAPDAILIEALSGESIDALWRYREIYPEVATTYGGRVMNLAALTRHTLQLDMPDAEAEVRRTLADWPAQPTPAQHRRLAALFVASGDPNSALVQWWRLAPDDRIAEDSVSALLVAALNEYDTRKNENHLIASRLVVRLGLERVYPTDDHHGDDMLIARMDDLTAFFSQSWMEQAISDPRFLPLREAARNLNTPEQLMQTYRYLNSRAAMQLDSDIQWRSMLERASPNMVGRTRVAEWEARNLRQVAHIREVAAQYPGRRILVVTGSAHKAWYEAYLRQMVDVQLVDAQRVLR